MGEKEPKKGEMGASKQCFEKKDSAKAAVVDDKFSFVDANQFSIDLLAAVRVRSKDKFLTTLAMRPDIANIQDMEGRTIMHYVASHAEGLEELLEVDGIDWKIRDNRQEGLLHHAVASNCPMSAFLLAKMMPECCLWENADKKNPMQMAHDKPYGEVLNAMLLGCCSEEANPKDSNAKAREAIKTLLEFGAVPDTWAPNGRSALMLAAAADSSETIKLLLAKNADISLQDTLHRTALMFAAAAGGEASVAVLMEAGGQQALSAQCNKGLNALGYADHDGVKLLIKTKFEELEKLARENESALLADLEEEAEKEAMLAAKKHKKTHRGQRKKKRGKRESATAESVPAETPLADSAEIMKRVLAEEICSSADFQSTQAISHHPDLEPSHTDCEAEVMHHQNLKNNLIDVEKPEKNATSCSTHICADGTDRSFQEQQIRLHLMSMKDRRHSLDQSDEATRDVRQPAEETQTAQAASSSRSRLQEQEYESWESRYIEDEADEWHEVKKESRKEAKKDNRRQSLKAVPVIQPPPPPPPPRTAPAPPAKKAGPVFPRNSSEHNLQPSKPPTQPFSAHTENVEAHMNGAMASGLQAQAKAMAQLAACTCESTPREQPETKESAKGSRTEPNFSWANVVVGKTEGMSNSISSPELHRLDVDAIAARPTGSLPVENQSSQPAWSQTLAEDRIGAFRQPSFSAKEDAAPATAMHCLDGIGDNYLLRKQNERLQARLVNLERWREQGLDSMQQLQLAHDLELKQARHSNAAMAKLHESERSALQRQVAQLQVELSKSSQQATLLHEELMQLKLAIHNATSNAAQVNAAQAQWAALLLQGRQTQQQGFAQDSSLFHGVTPAELQRVIDITRVGNTAQLAFRQMQMGGQQEAQGPQRRAAPSPPAAQSSPKAVNLRVSHSHDLQNTERREGSSFNVGAQPWTPRDRKPSSVGQAATGNTQAPKVASEGNQTARETRTPWDTVPAKMEGSGSLNMFDSIWKMDRSDREDSIKPDMRAIWESISAEKTQIANAS